MIDPAKETASWRASRAWTDVTIVDGRALMSPSTLNWLSNYSHTLPTGAYVAKRWRCLRGNTWWMGEYVDDPDPDQVGITWRPIDLQLDLGTPGEEIAPATVEVLNARRTVKILRPA